LFFAGTILGVAGIMRLFDALWAFRYDGAVPDELEGAVLGTSLSSYGWLWIVVRADPDRLVVRRVEPLAVRAAGSGSSLERCWRYRRSGGCVLPGLVLTYVIIGVLVNLRSRRPRWPPRSPDAADTSQAARRGAPAAGLDLYWIPLGAGAPGRAHQRDDL